MVYLQQSEIDRKLALKTQRLQRLAFPLHRFAAFVVDFSFVFFIHSVLCAYLRSLQELSYSLEYSYEFYFWVTLQIFIFFALFFIYDFCAHLFFATTIGKFAFKVHTIDIWSQEKLSFQQNLRRSFWKTFGFLFAQGLSFSLFYDLKRRAFHEKLSDTVTVSLTHVYSNAPNAKELSFFRGFWMPIQFTAVFFAIYFTIYSYHEIQREKIWGAIGIPMKSMCQEAEPYMSFWPEEENRLEAMTGLYLGKAISGNCLKKEATHFLKNKESRDLAFFALSLVQSEEKMRDKYREQVCATNAGGVACKLLQPIKNLASMPQEKVYQKAWLVTQLFDEGAYQDSFRLLAELKDLMPIRDFVQTYSAKNMWFLKPNDKVWTAFEIFEGGMEETTRQDLALWMCYQNAKDSCQLPSTCNAYAKKIDVRDANIEEKVAFLRISECEGGLPRLVDEEVKELVLAKESLRQAKNTGLLQKVMTNPKLPLVVRNEALYSFLRAKPLDPKWAQWSEKQSKTFLESQNRAPASVEEK